MLILETVLYDASLFERDMHYRLHDFAKVQLETGLAARCTYFEFMKKEIKLMILRRNTCQ